MIRLPPKYTLTTPLFPHTTLFRSKADFAHQPGQAPNEPDPFDPEDRRDGVMNIGRRHAVESKGEGGLGQARAVSPSRSPRAACPTGDRKSTRLNSSH